MYSQNTEGGWNDWI